MPRTSSPISRPLRVAAEADAEPDATNVDPAQLAGMIPAQLLQPGEIIILLIKPSILFVILEPLRSLLSILVLGAAAYWLANHDMLAALSRGDVVFITIAALAARLTWQFLEWLSRTYVLTDRRVVRIKGVLRVQVFECALKQINHTSTTFSLRERLFALGSISFATAGTAFQEATWQMIANPLEVHEQVVRAINRYT